MQADDTFLGIAVSKTEEVGVSIRKLTPVVKYEQEDNSKFIKKIKPHWLIGKAVFYHVPQTEYYIQLAMIDFQEPNRLRTGWYLW